MSIIVRVVSSSDYNAWSALYAGYAAFYEVDQTVEMRDRVWGWLHDAQHEVNGLLAVAPDGRAVGLAHYRPFFRPLSATIGGYLDDLFVAPSARGGEIGKLLINAIAVIGRDKGWSVIRWITAENNYRARSSYDKLASRTPWVTYDIKL